MRRLIVTLGGIPYEAAYDEHEEQVVAELVAAGDRESAMTIHLLKSEFPGSRLADDRPKWERARRRIVPD